MGIRTFSFNGESSEDYGILINENASFNAPERAGEMIAIPGRNGAYWHDFGRFENIEVKYHCVVGESNRTDFIDAMSDVREWLCSPIGYVRLEDDYNPNEYRMAVYKSGLDAGEPFVTGAEFDIVFECKPQRFLKSGETAISVTSGDTVTNPTLFDAHPQLQVKGYGGMEINGEEIVVEQVLVGITQIGYPHTTTSGKSSDTYHQSIATSILNNGDSIMANGKTATVHLKYSQSTPNNITSASITSTTGCGAVCSFTSKSLEVDVTFPDMTFTNGTNSTVNASCVLSYVIGGSTKSVTLSFGTSLVGTTRIDHTWTLTSVPAGVGTTTVTRASEVYGDSTKIATGNPLYIDLDIGEAWNEDGGSPVSLNNAVQMPAELPVLASGANTITYDNTFTSFDVVPRWWKV